MITVVAALIFQNNKVLLAKRSTGDQDVFGKWEFPGGKVEKGEDELLAIEREITEEFELKVHAKKFIVNHVYQYPTKTIDLRLYECEYVSGEFKLHDHSQYEWVDLEQILTYDLAPADIPLAKYVKTSGNMSR